MSSGFGTEPDRPKVSTIFSTQDGLSILTLLIMDYHAAIGGKTPCPPPLRTPQLFADMPDAQRKAQSHLRSNFFV